MARHRSYRRRNKPSPLVAAQIIMLLVVLAVVLFARTHAGRATANLVGFFGGGGDDVRVASPPAPLPETRRGVTRSRPEGSPEEKGAVPGDVVKEGGTTATP